MAERIHITTAIFYCNGTPHVGSAYEALAADAFARYQRRKLGRENVSFLSGTDEHGDKIRRAAVAAGTRAQGIHRQDERAVREAFGGLDVSYDYWVRTTDAVHEKFVQQMLRRTHERGDIYFQATTRGCTASAASVSTPKRNCCPGTSARRTTRPVELISEGNYFLRSRSTASRCSSTSGAIPTSSAPSAIAMKRSTCSPSR